MGVHVSRIQSLTLDNIGTSQLLLARVMSNTGFNDIMEATLSQSKKPLPSSSMEMRNQFIRSKYIERKFVIKTCSDESDLKADLEHAIISRHLLQLLQAFAEGADLTWSLPDSTHGETGLHYAVAQEDGTTLYIVDFLCQNSNNLNCVDNNGNTALHLCVMYDQSECMKLLLRSGANPSISNHNRITPIDLAKHNSNYVLIELVFYKLSIPYIYNKY
jgi:Arf-GAP with SH3 domain, ANK repeat and PH domain-containing protein